MRWRAIGPNSTTTWKTTNYRNQPTNRAKHKRSHTYSSVKFLAIFAYAYGPSYTHTTHTCYILCSPADRPVSQTLHCTRYQRIRAFALIHPSNDEWSKPASTTMRGAHSEAPIIQSSSWRERNDWRFQGSPFLTIPTNKTVACIPFFSAMLAEFQHKRWTLEIYCSECSILRPSSFDSYLNCLLHANELWFQCLMSVKR